MQITQQKFQEFKNSIDLKYSGANKEECYQLLDTLSKNYTDANGNLNLPEDGISVPKHFSKSIIFAVLFDLTKRGVRTQEVEKGKIITLEKV